MICPACGSKDVHRSHRHWWERPMVLIGIRPYRCSDCRHRFFSGTVRRYEASKRSQQEDAERAKKTKD